MNLTVTQLINVINTALEPLQTVVVQGEVDEFKIIHDKWVTFRLRDEESSIGCFMPVWKYRTQVEDGMLVRVQGHPKVRNKGFFSFDLLSIEPAGEGALKRAFELLRAKLTQEGLFAAARKRPLPQFPQHVVLITSRDAAAYSDFVKVLRARQGGLHVSFIHTQVQGEPAVRQLIQALEYANTTFATADALVLIRGGGSLEDLQAFNDERLVRAIAASRIPTIVGIGHERDVSLAELAADVRASTPSNAAELLVMSREELAATLTNFASRLQHQFKNALVTSRHDLMTMRQTLLVHMRQSLTTRTRAVHDMSRLLQSLAPEATLKRGYSITRTASGKTIRSAAEVSSGDTIETVLYKGKIVSTV